MNELIIKLHTTLNLIKGFVVGYSTMLPEQIMIDYKGKRYVATFEELCDSDDEDMYKTMDRYYNCYSFFENT
jgi:hypothetical protein